MHANANTHDDQQMAETLKNALRECLSPAAASAAAMFLQTVGAYRPANETAAGAFAEVVWLRDVLIEMVGVDEHNRLVDELGL